MISEILLFLTWSYTFYTALNELEKRRKRIKGNLFFPSIGKQRANLIYYKLRTIYRYFSVSVLKRFEKFIEKKYKASEILSNVASQLPCDQPRLHIRFKRSKLNRILEDLYIFSDFPFPLSIDLTENGMIEFADEAEEWEWGVIMDRRNVEIYMDSIDSEEDVDYDELGREQVNLTEIIRDNLSVNIVENSPAA